MTRAILLAIVCAAGCARASAPSTHVPAAPDEAIASATDTRSEVPPEPEPEPALAPEPAGPPPASSEPPGPAIEDELLAPLTDEELRVLQASPQDEAPEHRGGVTPDRAGKHYVAGNEKTLHAFYSSIVGIGGGYVGVGSDQAYLLIGWARPEIAWLTDYDPDVVDVHEIYRLCILASATPEELLLLWDKPARARIEALVDSEHQGRRAKHLKALWLRNRGWISRRLLSQRDKLREAGIPSWLTDQETFDYVRRMLEAKRVRPLVANLLDEKGIAGVAESARTLGVPIRVLYLSNAEEYWPKYTARFRSNVAALPFSEDALVLRTLLIWDVNEDYRYNVQRAENFLAWLGRPFVRNVYDVVHARPKPTRDAVNFFETEGDPDTSPAARRAQKAAAAPTRG
jgi:hypothetical protein